MEGDNPVLRIARMGHTAGLEGGTNLFLRIVQQNPLVWCKNLWCEIVQDNIVRERAMRNADFHYALPVELFKYKLGETMGYSEGYWVPGTENINQAKHNLYEYVCQKLLLKPGMKVLEVGAGWGFMAIYMVKNYDVDVVVYNPVKVQNEYMIERFKRHGVADRIRVVNGDHRDIAKEVQIFDRFVSIGVHEHHSIRKKMYALWWKSIASALKDGGIAVITFSSFMHYTMTGNLTLNYIWPGGHIPSIPLEISALHKAGFTLVEWENLWSHYYRTFKIWRDRFKVHWPHIHASNPEIFNEQFRRRWTMYVESIPEVFELGLDCTHFIVTKGRHVDGYAPTLEDRYRDARYKTGSNAVECYE